MAKPPDATAPLPIPSSSSSPQKKLSASSPLSTSLEEQRDLVLPLAIGAAMMKQALPSRKKIVAGTVALPIPTVSSSTTTRDIAPALTMTAISEQAGAGDGSSGGNIVKKWGSIEQLQESGFPNEMGKDSQWSMVERGT